MLKETAAVTRRTDYQDLAYGEPAYYLDVVVWLPDVWRSGVMPPCPECLPESSESNTSRDNHLGRRVTTLNSFYLAVSRRYICKRCQDARQHARQRQIKRQAPWLLVRQRPSTHVNVPRLVMHRL